MGKNSKKPQFGDLAIKMGLVSLAQIDECLRIQERMREVGRESRKLGEILVAKGYLTKEQVKSVFAKQASHGKVDADSLEITGYKILEKIGQGSMGSIFKAVQLSMDRVVALKILAPKYAENRRFVERFLREARAVAKLNHPNIIQGFDVGESGGVHYFAMEYIDGPTVGSLMKRGGALEEKRATRIAMQVCKALVHAEQHGLLHRDIKPDNIMLTRDGVAKLCDLGLAKITSGSPSATNPGASMGTPYYVSPEQARGEADVDIRTDIYSLGATYYHMACGTVPFLGETAAVVISKALTEELESPRKRNGDISKDVDFVIKKMMERDRDNRYQTAKELLEVLEKVLEGKPIGRGNPRGSRRTRTAGVGNKIRRRRMMRRRR
jgi:serine/threonine-protein kinase